MLSGKLCTFLAQRKCSACPVKIKIVDFVRKNSSFLRGFGRSFIKIEYDYLWSKFLFNA